MNRLHCKDHTIFMLRITHAQLNRHLQIITADHTPYYNHCNRQEEETVKHHLIECPALQDAQKQLLPPNPSITNTLYTDTTQLKKTCIYHHLAQGIKSESSQPRGSDK